MIVHPCPKKRKKKKNPARQVVSALNTHHLNLHKRQPASVKNQVLAILSFHHLCLPSFALMFGQDAWQNDQPIRNILEEEYRY